jgi:hypothetical protein
MVYGQGPKNNSTVTSIKFYAQLRFKEGGVFDEVIESDYLQIQV